MSIVLITRGLPGSGKSTEGRKWAQHSENRVYMDRDNLREMLFGRSGLLASEQEDLVTEVQHEALRAALGDGWSTVLADTFLRDDRLDPILKITATYDARVEYLDLRHVPLDVCIERDRARGAAGGREVGEDIIRIMAKRYGLD